MADKRPIGVFDSGVGGLTVVSEIIKVLPNEDIIYFGDTKRVPYGTKSNETIFQFAREDESFLLSKDVKMIIAACGTVSAVASDTAKELSVPFMGVVSNAAVAAVKATQNKIIGVLGTPATISSLAHKKEILKLLPDATVYNQACPLFVPLVEAGWTSPNDTVVYNTALNYLEQVKKNGVDTLILGCTHYPLLTDVIKQTMGDNVTLINMGEATASAAFELLKNNDMLSDSVNNGECKIYVSDLTDVFCETASLILNKPITKNEVVEVEIENLA